jgi:hypothetical protein
MSPNLLDLGYSMMNGWGSIPIGADKVREKTNRMEVALKQMVDDLPEIDRVDVGGQFWHDLRLMMWFRKKGFAKFPANYFAGLEDLLRKWIWTDAAILKTLDILYLKEDSLLGMLPKDLFHQVLFPLVVAPPFDVGFNLTGLTSWEIKLLVDQNSKMKERPMFF